MARTLPILVGLALLLGGGVVHGLWTDRWQTSEEVSEAAARVGRLPAVIGDWKSEPYEQQADELAMAGAVAHYSRTFTDPETGEPVVVILLVGRATRMVVHRPEQCYTAVGYSMDGPAGRVTVQAEGLPPAELSTALFSRPEATGLNQLRIYWSFGTSGGWEAPANPRLRYARRKVLYKLYVLRTVTGSPGKDEPCLRLLEKLLPVLDRDLHLDS